MSQKVGRDPLKRPKDRKQGIALLNVIRESMPQYPLNDEFSGDLPDELQPFFERWSSGDLS